MFTTVYDALFIAAIDAVIRQRHAQMSVVHVYPPLGVAGLPPAVRVYREDTPDGPNLFPLCSRCGAGGAAACLLPTENVQAVIDLLRKVGCEACRVNQQAAVRGAAIVARLARGVAVEVR